MAIVGLISLSATPFLAIPWRSSSAQVSPDEYQNFQIPVNVQNMALLKAATNSTPYLKNDDLTSPTVVDDQAILHENRVFARANASSTMATSDFNSDSSDQISLYVVREGDTLAQIAGMYNVTSNTIRWANDLNSKDPIKKGQQLVILPITGIKYVVKKGDDIKSIASSFGGDQQEIVAYNGLEGKNIGVGDEIIIPNGEVQVTSKTNSSSNVSSKPTKSSSSNTTSKKTSQNLASKGINSGYFMRPIIGGIKTQGIHGHNGVDLASSRNTPILAAASGKVIIAKPSGWNGGYGDYVVISHSNGMQTLYGHMNSLNVSQGQNVTKGDVIGYMGSTGDSSGVHLHFEVRGGVNPF